MTNPLDGLILITMFGSLHIGRVIGIPIRLHFTLLILLPYFALHFGEVIRVPPVWGFMAAVLLFASVALHELGHSVVALRFRYNVKDILLTPIGGIATLTTTPRRARDEFWIAIAGPLVSVALGVVFLFATYLPALAGMLNVARVMNALGVMNIGLAVFNMLPCFPMDGGRVFRAWLSVKHGRLEATRRALTLSRVLSWGIGIWGLLNFNLLTMLLAWFVSSSAKAEYRLVQLQEAPPMDPFGFGSPWSIHTFNWPPQQPPTRPPADPDEIEVTVSPPPYRR